MKIGMAVPNIGPVATPEAVKTVAQKAESLGYHSLWTVERVLWPVNPRSPYPATPDGSLPEEYKYCLDPLDTLTFAAACTSTIKLGTSVLDIPSTTLCCWPGGSAPLTCCRRDGSAWASAWAGRPMRWKPPAQT